MPVTYKYKSDIIKAIAKQTPFAASKALNDTAFDVRKTLIAETPKHLDKPTSFTLSAFQVKRSNKRNLTAHVFIEEKRDYLKYQVEGGTRLPKKKAHVVPNANHIKLNKHGNMPKGRIKRLLTGKKTFSGQPHPHMPGGIWQRTGGKKNKGLKLLVRYEPSAQYEKRLPFYEIAEKVINKVWVQNFERQLAEALRTAQPPLRVR